MSEELVRLKIDDIDIRVPKGTLVVDAAKQAGIEIPVFCHHPKIESVGMCRMCLVEIGTPKRDRSTGENIVDEAGQMQIEFWPKLETSCTTPVSEGMVVKVSSEKAKEGRKQILEFLLTSHPLDCPICDKGGECSLQDLTMGHGSGESRFLLDDKKHQDKHVQLGDLIVLDRASLSEVATSRSSRSPTLVLTPIFRGIQQISARSVRSRLWIFASAHDPGKWALSLRSARIARWDVI
jgi:NADH-quinone oxidoreductase subunit G